MDLQYEPTEVMRTDGVGLIDLVRHHDLDTSIPACPEWYLRDLAGHVGGVWTFWARVVERGITSRHDLRDVERAERPADDALLVDWLAICHNELYATLTQHEPDQAVWTWTGANRDVSWVRRRMAQETAVHRWDAARAVGDPYVVPTVVAADGIDEFLTWFAASERAEGAMKVGGTVHLHCTDTGDASLPEGVNGEWYIGAMKEPAATFTREHRKGDAAIRGTAHDILMWLWRRDNNVEIIGDKVVARRFRAFTDLG